MIVDPENPKNIFKNTSVSQNTGNKTPKTLEDYRTLWTGEESAPPTAEWYELKERLRRQCGKSKHESS